MALWILLDTGSNVLLFGVVGMTMSESREDRTFCIENAQLPLDDICLYVYSLGGGGLGLLLAALTVCIVFPITGDDCGGSARCWPTCCRHRRLDRPTVTLVLVSTGVQLDGK